jgi:hypothetical protein
MKSRVSTNCPKPFIGLQPPSAIRTGVLVSHDHLLGVEVIPLHLSLSHDEDRKMAGLVPDSRQQKYSSGRGIDSVKSRVYREDRPLGGDSFAAALPFAFIA